MVRSSRRASSTRSPRSLSKSVTWAPSRRISHTWFWSLDRPVCSTTRHPWSRIRASLTWATCQCSLFVDSARPVTSSWLMTVMWLWAWPPAPSVWVTTRQSLLGCSSLASM